MTQTINQLINGKRLAMGISVAKLAERLGIEPSGLRRSMNDKRDLRPDELLALMEYFKIPVSVAIKTQKRDKGDNYAHYQRKTAIA